MVFCLFFRTSMALLMCEKSANSQMMSRPDFLTLQEQGRISFWSGHCCTDWANAVPPRTDNNSQTIRHLSNSLPVSIFLIPAMKIVIFSSSFSTLSRHSTLSLSHPPSNFSCTFNLLLGLRSPHFHCSLFHGALVHLIWNLIDELS